MQELPEGIDPNLAAALEAWDSAAQGTWLYLEAVQRVESDVPLVGSPRSGLKTGQVRREVILRAGSQAGTEVLREGVADIPWALHVLAEGLRLGIKDGHQLRVFMWDQMGRRAA